VLNRPDGPRHWARLSERVFLRAPEQPLLTALWRGSAIALLISVTSVALRWAIQVLVARWIGVSAFGHYSYALAIAQIFAVVAGLGLGPSAVKLIPDYAARARWALLRGFVRRSRGLTALAGLGLGAAASVLLLLVRPRQFDMTTLVLGLMLAPLIALSNLEQELSRARERILITYALPQILQPALEVATVCGIWVLAGQLSAGLALGMRIGTIAGVLLPQMTSLRSALPREVLRVRPGYEDRRWLSIAAPMLAIGLGSILSSRGDLIVLGWLRPADEVGIYSAALSIAALVSLILTATVARAGPMFSTLFASDRRSELERCAQHASRLSLWPSLPLIVLLALCAKPLLALYGRDFDRGIVPLMVLLIGQLINATTGPVGYLLAMTGYERRMVMVVVGAAIVDFLISLVLVPWFGMTGAALSSMLALAFWNLWLVQIARGELGINPIALWPRR
jgi:O-antigen/teichoic acid export membrane protein